MGFRLGLVLLLFALAIVGESLSFDDAKWDSSIAHFDLDSFRYGSSSGAACNGRVGDCISEVEEMIMDSEVSRRVLASTRFISYSALKANSIPCGRRGRPYYNCNKRGPVNPYRRGCSYITRCARYTD